MMDVACYCCSSTTAASQRGIALLSTLLTITLEPSMPLPNIDLSLPLLVVDDNQQMRSVVKGILADLGFANVFLAGSGEEACRILNERPIAAVISDLDMPGMNGLQLLRWVRSTLADKELPFMLLPGEANREGLLAATPPPNARPCAAPPRPPPRRRRRR
jgi:CheY-like chemotaxis protein